MPDLFPFGVYDTKQRGMTHIGLYATESDCWKIFLGWPAPEEVDFAKSNGLVVLPLTINYRPPVKDSLTTETRWKLEMADFEPGWLMRTVHAAHISYMANHNPQSLRTRSELQLPLPENEARELYEFMNARFKRWTGMDIADVAPPKS